MASFLQVLRDIVLLLVRLGLGSIMLMHGVIRWRWTGVQRQIDYLSQFGVPYPEYAAWGAILLEMIGGIFLIVGALTPLVALAFLVQQALTISYTNYYRMPWLLNTDGSYNGGYEYNVAIGLLALVLVAFGAGRIAVDRLFRRDKTPEVEDDDSTSTYPAQRVTAA